MFEAIDISTSALVAQRQRMNIVAGNLANMNSTRNADGELAPFQRRFVTFEAASVRPRASGRTNGAGASGDPLGVAFQVQVDTASEPRRVFQPAHPDADAEGYVAFPNVSMMTEFVNAVEASRAYQANASAVTISRSMTEQALQLLG